MLRNSESDIYEKVNSFIENIFDHLHLGIADNIFHIMLIIGALILLGLTLFTLVLYKLFYKKLIKRTIYVFFTIWAVITMFVSLIIFALAYNWFGILNPLAIFIDPTIKLFAKMISSSGEVGINFFDGFISNAFGSKVSLDTLTTETLVKFILKIPLLFAWINTVIIISVIVAIKLAPRYKFVKLTVKVIYFIGFFIMLFISVWALVFSITTDVKIGTMIEILVKTQAQKITSGVTEGIKNVKDDALIIIDDLLSKLENIDKEKIAKLIIDFDGTNVIFGGKLNLDVKLLSSIFDVSIPDIEKYVFTEQNKIMEMEITQIKDLLNDSKTWLQDLA